MNKIIKGLIVGTAIAGLFIGASKVFASTAYDWHFSLRNNTNTGDVSYDLPEPGDSNDRILLMDGISKLPKWVAPGGGLAFHPTDGLIVSGIEMEKVTGLISALSTKASLEDVNYFYNLQQQNMRVQTNSSGIYTWTFSSPFPSGVTPVVTVVAEDSTSGALTNAQITNISSTSVTIQTRRLSTILGILTLTTNPQVYVDITAIAPN